MRYLQLFVLVISLVGMLMISNAFAQEATVPSWVKNTAGWWATDAISETEFVNAIEFLVKENIIQVNVSQTSETSQGVPDWVKNTAGWWATDAISETEFVNAIAYMIKAGIINIESSKSPELIAEMWVNGNIKDSEFLANVEQLIEEDVITMQSDSITKTSQLPDWLVNNAGWWAARIFTNSDFSDFDIGYVKEKIYPCKENSTGKVCLAQMYNSLGLRGNEIKKEKPDNMFRIFTVGGSTTLSTGVRDSETWPVLLQQIINEKIMEKNIEVINAGISGGTSKTGYDMIKNKLLSFDPDLIIMYDGWNDSKCFKEPEHELLIFDSLLESNLMQNCWQADVQGQEEQEDDVRISPKETIHNWKSVCKLGKNEGFDTIIVVQPLPLTGYRVLTEQEIENVFHSATSLLTLHKFPQYVDAFEELDGVCTKTADFRRIFDYVQEPIFFDAGHTMSFGNKIIAENVFSVISPIYFGKTHSVIHSLQTENNESGVVYAVGSDLSGRNFDNLNLQNAVFDKADLSNTSFKNTNIDGARFVFADLNNSNLLDRIDLSNINFAGANLPNMNLNGRDLSGTILTGADLSNSNLTGVNLSGNDMAKAILIDVDLSNAILTGANLQHANLDGANVMNADFTSADFTGVNLAGTNLKDAKFDDATFVGVKFDGFDISLGSLPEINFRGADLSQAILTNTDLSDMDLSFVNLSGHDLSDHDMTNTILRGANLTDAILPDGVLSGKNLEWTKFHGVDLSGEDLSSSKFQYASFDNANMKNVNLSESELIQVDLTKIKDKSLAGADLFSVILAHSNLSGVNLDGITLEIINFQYTDLTNQDFTNSVNITGNDFLYAELSNSNFEDTILSPKKMFSKVFKDKSHLINLDDKDIIEELFGKLNPIIIISMEVQGNDLVVDYILNNNFAGANLKNANFKNAELIYVNFSSANLRNADLSGADLRSAFFVEADLSNANLEGANLQDALLDNAILSNANLKCLNHPICLNG